MTKNSKKKITGGMPGDQFVNGIVRAIAIPAAVGGITVGILITLIPSIINSFDKIFFLLSKYSQLAFLNKKDYYKYRNLLEKGMPECLEIVESLEDRELTDMEIKKIQIVNDNLKELVKIFHDRFVEQSSHNYLFKSNKIKDAEKLIKYILEIEKKQKKFEKTVNELTGRFKSIHKLKRSATRYIKGSFKKSKKHQKSQDKNEDEDED